MKKNNFILILLFIITFPLKIYSLEIKKIVKKIRPAVVQVLNYKDYDILQGTGTGFFINKKGYIITNYHVIADAKKIKIKTYTGKIYTINKIIGVNYEKDIAILYSTHLPIRKYYIKFAHKKPEVGDKVVVIGNPYSLNYTVSDGIVSAIRDLFSKGDGEIIQITAPVSPGSSGSPVLNKNGEVIGMVTMQFKVGQNLNFAIRLNNNLIKKNYFKKPLVLNKWKQKRKKYTDISLSTKLQLSAFYILTAETYYEATERTKEVFDTFPELSKGLSMNFILGVYYLKMLDSKRFKYHFQYIIDKQPDFMDAALVLGEYYEKSGDYYEAIKLYKSVIPSYLTNPQIFNRLGDCYRAIGENEEALNNYNTAIEIDHKNEDAYYKKAKLYKDLLLYDNARITLKKLLKINPYNADAHFLLGKVYVLLNKKEKALKEYEALKSLDFQKAEKLLEEIYTYDKPYKKSEISGYNELVENNKNQIIVQPPKLPDTYSYDDPYRYENTDSDTLWIGYTISVIAISIFLLWIAMDYT